MCVVTFVPIRVVVFRCMQVGVDKSTFTHAYSCKYVCSQGMHILVGRAGQGPRSIGERSHGYMDASAFDAVSVSVSTTVTTALLP